MTTVRKLIVQVVGARNLQPKDGHGKSSPYVILCFHGQRYKTRTIAQDLNPLWDQVVKFNVAQSSPVFDDLLEINVKHNKKSGPTTRSKNLGRVSLDAKKFVTKGDELIYYDLKKHCWSCIHGQIGLKIYFVDEVVPPPPVPNPPTATPPEKKETPPPGHPAQPPVSTPPPYHFPWEYRSCSSSLAEEESYPVDLSLTSIVIVFLLCFLILCLIVAF